jgi:hypothetical protein
MKKQSAAEKENSSKTKQDEKTQERILAAKRLIRANGGEVIEKTVGRTKIKTFKLPRTPGLRLLSAGDCLTNYAGFVRSYEEEETKLLINIQTGNNILYG